MTNIDHPLDDDDHDFDMSRRSTMTPSLPCHSVIDIENFLVLFQRDNDAINKSFDQMIVLVVNMNTIS